MRTCYRADANEQTGDRPLPSISRRDLIKAGALLGLAGSRPLLAEETMLTRPVPATGQALPVIGLGTYDVFDVASTPDNIAARREILDALGDAGGSVIDTSPMYNRSEAVVGDALAKGNDRADFFLATKVWTDGREAGERQMRRSAELMRTDTIDLMQVHNRRDLDTHWQTIQGMQETGFIRYNGVTDYRASAHEAMVAIMKRYRPQFIQINYSLGEREAELEVLPVAQDLGIAVLVNRPFVAGRLFRAVGDRPLPAWAAGVADSWGQFFLKYIVSHPAVTTVIPATSKLKHMVDNAGAGFGPMPDEAMRQRMVAFVETL
jgi:diketogulonate reductase-like aldo/keto reductase